MSLKNTLRYCGFALLIGCAGCPGDPPESDSVELTRRQKDSIVADLPVPGAGGVGKALDALGASEARKIEHDSIS